MFEGLLLSTKSLAKSHLKTGITLTACDSELTDQPIHYLLHASDGVVAELELLTDTRVALLRHSTVRVRPGSPTTTRDPLHSSDGWEIP